MGTSWDEFLHFKTYPGWNHIKTIQKILRIHGALSWERGVPVTNPGQPIKGSFSLCLLRFAKKTHQLQPYFSDKKRKWFLRKGRRRLVASSNHAPKQPKREKLRMRRSKTAIFCTQEIAKKKLIVTTSWNEKISRVNYFFLNWPTSWGKIRVWTLYHDEQWGVLKMWKVIPTPKCWEYGSEGMYTAWIITLHCLHLPHPFSKKAYFRKVPLMVLLKQNTVPTAGKAKSEENCHHSLSWLETHKYPTMLMVCFPQIHASCPFPSMLSFYQKVFVMRLLVYHHHPGSNKTTFCAVLGSSPAGRHLKLVNEPAYDWGMCLPGAR